MGLETATYISQLVSSNPVGNVDPYSTADDHLRLLKAVLQASFPNISGAMTMTHTELNGIKNAANLSTGTLADARLSANVPLLNAQNIFLTNQFIQSTDPRWYFDDTNAGSGLRSFFFDCDGGIMSLWTAADGTYSAVAPAYQVTKNAAGAVVTFDIFGTTVRVNSQDVRNAAILNSGTLADARVAQSNVTQHQAALSLAASQITSGLLAIARGGTNATDAPTARTNLGLGSIATQNSNAVTITGGSITGITDLAIADGGTGASSASSARSNLGLGDAATRSIQVQSGGSPSGGADGDLFLIY